MSDKTEKTQKRSFDRDTLVNLYQLATEQKIGTPAGEIGYVVINQLFPVRGESEVVGDELLKRLDAIQSNLRDFTTLVSQTYHASERRTRQKNPSHGQNVVYADEAITIIPQRSCDCDCD